MTTIASPDGSSDARVARNLLTGVGAFYASQWLHVLLQVAGRELAAGVGLSGGGRVSVVSPFVSSLSMFVGAAAAGVATVWVVQSPRPARWAFVPAALWLLLAFSELGVMSRNWFEGGALALAILLPSIVCIAAGRTASWHRGDG